MKQKFNLSNKNFKFACIVSIVILLVLSVYMFAKQTKPTRAAYKLDGVYAWNPRPNVPGSWLTGKYSINFELPAIGTSYDGFMFENSGDKRLTPYGVYYGTDGDLQIVTKCAIDNYWYSRGTIPTSLTPDAQTYYGQCGAGELPLYEYMVFGDATLNLKERKCEWYEFFKDTCYEDGDLDEFYEWFNANTYPVESACYELNGVKAWEYPFTRPGSFPTGDVQMKCHNNSGSSTKKYTVTYDKNGGDTISKDFDYVTKNTQVDLPSATWEEHTLTGWNTEADGSGTSYDSNSKYTVTGTAELFAQWDINEYEVTYNPNGGSVNPNKVTVEYGKTTNLPKPTRTGYTFTGWYTAATEGTPVGKDGDPYTVTKKTTLYAHWLLNEVPKFEVTYNANGGIVSPNKVTVESGKTTNLPKPTRTGYTFTGWYTAATGGTPVGKDGDSYTVTKKITLYAHWDINEYTITYNANGGSVTPENVPVEYGKTTELPEATWPGHTFLGWYTAATAGDFKGMQGVSYTVTEDVMLYAHWAEISKETYLIRYNANGGDSVPYATAYSDTGYITSEYPKRFGYMFTGWVEDPLNCNKTKLTSDDSFTNENVDLYACWEMIENTDRCSLRNNPETSDRELIVLAVLAISTLSWLYSYFIMKKVKQ